MREFDVNKDSIGLMKTAYSTYEGSSVLTDYWNNPRDKKTAVATKDNKEKPIRLEEQVSSTQVTTP